MRSAISKTTIEHVLIILIPLLLQACGGALQAKREPAQYEYHPVIVHIDPVPPESFVELPSKGLPVSVAELDTELHKVTGASAFWLGDPGERSYVVEVLPSPETNLTGEQAVVPLILVHGLGKSGLRDFYPVLAKLARSRPLLLIDLPALGRSETAQEELTPLFFARRVAQVIRARVKGPFDLLGHSLGGNVCLTLAAHPKFQPRRLVIVDAAGVLHREVFVKNQLARGAKSISETHEGLGVWIGGLGRTMVETFSDVGPFDKATVNFANNLPGAGSQSAMGLIFHRVAPFIATIKAPTLLVWGKADRLAPLRTAQLLRDRIGNATLHVIPGAGHVPMKEAPEPFTKAVLGFLDGPLPAQGSINRSGNARETMIDCQGEGEHQLSGRFSSLELVDCPAVEIYDAEIGRLKISDSLAQLTNVVVSGGTSVYHSAVVVTGGTFNGTIGLYLEDSVADIAGADIKGTLHAVASQKGASLLLSATLIHSSHYQGAIHDKITLDDGDAL